MFEYGGKFGCLAHGSAFSDSNKNLQMRKIWMLWTLFKTIILCCLAVGVVDLVISIRTRAVDVEGV